MPVNVRLTIDPTTVVTISDAEYADLEVQGLIYALEGGKPILRAAFDSGQYGELDDMLFGRGTYSGFTAKALAPWHRALALVAAGESDAKVLCVGDSTTAGVGVDGTWQGTTGSYPAVLARMLNDNGTPAAVGLAHAGPDTGNPDKRFTLGSGWSRARNAGAYYGFGSGSDVQWQAGGGVTNAPLDFVSGVEATHFDIYYLVNAGLGKFTVSVPGGNVATVDTSDTSNALAGGVKKFTYQAPNALRSNHLVLASTDASGGDIHVVGIEPWNNDRRQVRVGNGGVGGSQSVAWADSGSFASINSVKAYDPDLVIVSLGLNDIGGNVSVSDYAARLKAIVDGLPANTSVIVAGPIPPAGDVDGPYLRKVNDYAGVARDLGTPFVDLWQAYVNPNDPALVSMRWDSIHPNAVGYAFLARVFYQAPGAFPAEGRVKAPGAYSATSTMASNSDMNSIVVSGNYNGENMANSPVGNGWYFLEVIRYVNDDLWCLQRATGMTGEGAGHTYTRIRSAGPWSGWAELALK